MKKNLSCGEISPHDRLSCGDILRMTNCQWEKCLRMVNMEKNLSCVLLQNKFCCNLRCFVAESIFFCNYALLHGKNLTKNCARGEKGQISGMMLIYEYSWQVPHLCTRPTRQKPPTDLGQPESELRRRIGWKWARTASSSSPNVRCSSSWLLMARKTVRHGQLADKRWLLLN